MINNSIFTFKKVFLALAILLFFSCKKKFEQSEAFRQDITESVFATGFVKSINQYQVFTVSSGIIENIYVEEGDTVKINQPILKLKNDAATLNTENARLTAEYNDFSKNNEKLEELKASIELLKAKLKSDSLLFQRQQNLWKNNIGSKIDLEKMELNFKNSKTAYESTVHKYNDLKKQLALFARQSKNNFKISSSIYEDFIVKSRIKGKVYNLLKKQGEMVSPQFPVAVIGSSDSFKIELQIDEYDIAKVKTGQEVFVTMDSYKKQVFEATIDKIYPAMNERTRSFTIEAHFIKQPPFLYPNITAEANIVVNKKENAITIDNKFLIEDSFVYINKKEKIKVITGLKDLQKVEILSGLKEKDKIYLPLK